MKFTARRVAKLLSLTMFLICLPWLTYADDCPDIVDPDYPCPLDSWVIVLLFAGIIYGVYKAGSRAPKSPPAGGDLDQVHNL